MLAGPSPNGQLLTHVLLFLQSASPAFSRPVLSPAGMYNCVAGLRSFIPFTHPRVHFTEGHSAHITLPEPQEPLYLQHKQEKPTIRQKYRQHDTLQAKRLKQEQQQARWDALVLRWQKQHGVAGPETPFVTVSYEDNYMKVRILAGYVCPES